CTTNYYSYGAFDFW
nr:immunoglobulin heavy chain junction region [Macaca mulatta]